MSIRQMILERVQEGRLHAFYPLPLSGRRYREMYLTDELRRYFVAPQDVEVQRLAELEADLAVFVQSPSVDPNYIFCLHPVRDCVWEIRSVQPEPSIRVFGQFAAKDLFIAMHFELRSMLGEWERKEWKISKRRAGSTWRSLFPAYNPMAGNDAKLLVTGAIDGKYFRSKPPV
jgi:hypothetical protein